MATNPLREGLSRVKTPQPCVMVIFGASGDLTQGKLVPALFALKQQGLLPREFSVVGISRRPLSHEEFREQVKPDDCKDEAAWSEFSQSLFYMSGDYNQDQCYEDLTRRLGEVDQERGTGGNRLFYLSVAPSAFPVIVSKLGQHGMADDNDNGWVRVILEKPFGTDLESALSLNREVHRTFNEQQIYRIDHYLGKETVQNILAFRFANGIFEPIWNRRYIDHIQVTAAETVGVGQRAGYYDKSGALRDMVQNHLMQLLALVAMEPPTSFDADAVRDEKVKVMRAIRTYAPDEVPDNAIRGQYDAGFIDGKPVQGYREAEGVAPDSQNETYAAVRFRLDNWRWQGVPFYLRTGKCLARKVTEVAIVFKPVPHSLFGALDEGLAPNVLVIKIGPEEGIALRFATKLPGMTTRIRWVNMDFDYGESFATPSPTAYQRLLHDCMIGDATLYTRADGIEAAWVVCQPILDYWAADPQPIPRYEAGSWGPREAETWMEDEGRYWRKL
ncbi:MAG: glucose-6-phosphate dehydrogenase [Vulcanimicrobiota bacterium]